MRKEDIVAYVRRDWDAIAESKLQRWSEQKAKMTPAESLQVGDQLRHHALSLHPDWPTAEDRQQDLLTHIRVAESLRRVGSRRR